MRTIGLGFQPIRAQNKKVLQINDLQDFWCDGGVDGAQNSDKNAYQVSTVSSIRRDVQS